MSDTPRSDSGDASPDDATLTIDAPAQSTADQAIQVRVTDAPPGSTVGFEATLTDDDGVTWRSHAFFGVDDTGIVDLVTDAPDDGSWMGVEPMAWLWSMDTDAEVMGASLGDDPTIDVELQATAGDHSATQTITRELYDPAITSTTVDGEDLVGTLFEPPDGGPAPAVIDLHGSAGRQSHWGPRLLATHGFTVLALDYVGDDPGLPDDLVEIDLTYFDLAADWLLDRDATTGARVGLVGASRGAEAALLLGAHRDWVGAVVSYAGSGVPWDTPQDAPAWLDRDDPVPHIVADNDHPNQTNLDEKPLADRLPPVEQTDGPILLLSGGSDPVWDARRLSQVVVDHLDATDFDHRYEHRTYDDVGHYIGIPYLPLGGFGDLPKMHATAHAGEDSWPVVLDYLATGLSPQAED